MFGLAAILPIALIDRLRFLFLSPLFLVRTFTKADFCLAPPPPPPSTSPSSSVPIELLQLKRYFYLDTQHEMKTQTIDRHCAVRAREGWVKKLCSLNCHNNQNTDRICKSLSYQLKGTLFKNLSLSQESNIKQSSFTKDSSIHKKYSYVLFFMQPHITLRICCTKINVLWNFTSITMTLFSITLKLVSFFCLN